jgi:hypothetical protein
MNNINTSHHPQNNHNHHDHFDDDEGARLLGEQAT